MEKICENCDFWDFSEYEIDKTEFEENEGFCQILDFKTYDNENCKYWRRKCQK